MLADAQAQRHSGQAGKVARIKATYNNQAPYTEAELRRSDWLDGTARVTNPPIDWSAFTSSYNSTPEIKD
jgi:hypothetical protein